MPSRKGSPNRNKKFLLTRLQDMYGDEFRPIMRMAEQATRLHEIAQNGETGDIKASIDAWDKIAAYTEPKLKATEVDLTTSDGSMSPTVIELIPRLPEESYEESQDYYDDERSEH